MLTQRLKNKQEIIERAEDLTRFVQLLLNSSTDVVFTSKALLYHGNNYVEGSAAESFLSSASLSHMTLSHRL